jgi:hypothetical protein
MAFKQRSGYNPSFKMMGSSPLTQRIVTGGKKTVKLDKDVGVNYSQPDKKGDKLTTNEQLFGWPKDNERVAQDAGRGDSMWSVQDSSPVKIDKAGNSYITNLGDYGYGAGGMENQKDNTKQTEITTNISPGTPGGNADRKHTGYLVNDTYFQHFGGKDIDINEAHKQITDTIMLPKGLNTKYKQGDMISEEDYGTTMREFDKRQGIGTVVNSKGQVTKGKIKE